MCLEKVLLIMLVLLTVVARAGSRTTYESIGHEISANRYPYLSEAPQSLRDLLDRHANDSSADRYIVANCDAGLANRLRVLFAYQVIAHAVFHAAHLLFVWDINSACPDHFLSVFEPIQNVTFISTADLPVFGPKALQVFNISHEPFNAILTNHDINFVVRKRDFWRFRQILYNQLVPIAGIRHIITQYVTKNNICSAYAVHVRRTDLWDLLYFKKRAHNNFYFGWIDSLPANASVFLMTDNAITQGEFYARYGIDRILVYQNISTADDTSSTTDLNTTSTAVNIGDSVAAPTPKHYSFFIENGHRGNGTNSSLPDNARRFTTLQHAVIDMWIAAHAIDLRPTLFSSASELVKSISWLHRYHWCP
jgi:hypothetical protein